MKTYIQHLKELKEINKKLSKFLRVTPLDGSALSDHSGQYANEMREALIAKRKWLKEHQTFK